MCSSKTHTANIQVENKLIVWDDAFTICITFYSVFRNELIPHYIEKIEKIVQQQVRKL